MILKGKELMIRNLRMNRFQEEYFLLIEFKS